MAVDIHPGSTSADPDSLVTIGGTLFFRAFASSGHLSLLVSDGTVAGTSEMYFGFIDYGPTPSVDSLTNFRGRLLFAGTDCFFGTELWTSNGRLYGTEIVQDIQPSRQLEPEQPDGVGQPLVFRRRRRCQRTGAVGDRRHLRQRVRVHGGPRLGRLVSLTIAGLHGSYPGHRDAKSMLVPAPRRPARCPPMGRPVFGCGQR